ncbi:hypothetical protein [Rhabdochromatium marinum]|uniref:hypothetical protein n=1 Tax=Rhabdochromatium marinum TaxID=48729 RepID=UPI0019078511|nr:hypothetical protein [Rhabdochromatium marinum]
MSEMKNYIFAKNIYDLDELVEIDWLPEFEEIMDYNIKNKLGLDLVVHGSYGDFTYNNFSDLELTVIFNKPYNKIDKKSAINIINRKIHKLCITVDPLQHHGPFFITSKDILCYKPKSLPLEAYQSCWSLRDVNIKFHLKNTDSEFEEISKWRYRKTIDALREPKKSFFKHGKNLYSIKRMLSNFFMIPVYSANANGMRIEKREAIEQAANIFPDYFIMALKCGTDIRSSWPKKNNLLSYIRKKIVRDRIPQGNFDLVSTKFFREKIIEHKIEEDFLPLLNKAVKEIEWRHQ